MASADSSFRKAQPFIWLLALIALIEVVTFTPKAHAQSGDVYGVGQSQVVGSTMEGIVLQVSMKKTQASVTAQATGTSLGAMLGGFLGNSVQDPNARGAATALGAMLGGVGGNLAAERVSSSDAQEIVVALRNPTTGRYGGAITVVQPAPFTPVSAKQKVLVVQTGGAIRIIPQQYD